MFEDSVVDFFETADTDRDGLIDYEDFYNVSKRNGEGERVGERGREGEGIREKLYIERELFYNVMLQLLASPLVASRVYRSQMEQLLGLYQALTTGTQGQMNIASFPTIANSLLLMIYQNAYPDVVRSEHIVYYVGHIMSIYHHAFIYRSFPYLHEKPTMHNTCTCHMCSDVIYICIYSYRRSGSN